MSGLRKDINVLRNYLTSRRLQKPRDRSGDETGPEAGRPPYSPGRPPLLESNQDSASWEISTDLKDESKPYNLCQFDPTVHIHLKGL